MVRSKRLLLSKTKLIKYPMYAFRTDKTIFKREVKHGTFRESPMMMAEVRHFDRN
jgi:hypothetical protein